MKRLLSWYWRRRHNNVVRELKARFGYRMWYPVKSFKPEFWRQHMYMAIEREAWLKDELNAELPDDGPGERVVETKIEGE